MRVQKRGRGSGYGEDRRQSNYEDRSGQFTERTTENEAFTEYYQTQGIVPDGEWDAFVDILRQPLPITFRINGSGKFATDVRDKLQSDFFSHFANGPIMVSREEAVEAGTARLARGGGSGRRPLHRMRPHRRMTLPSGVAEAAIP